MEDLGQNKPPDNPAENDWDKAFLELTKSPINESSLKTPTMVQWLIGLCVTLFSILFFLGQVLPENRSGLYLMVSSISILLIASFGLYALSKAANQSKHLKNLLNIDRTTGLFSSVFLMEELDRLISEGNHNLVLIFLDLDELKLYNDKYGHRRGDILIRNAGEALIEAIAGHGVGFRYGGDEFVAILANVSRENAIEFAKRVHRSFVMRGISASIGIYPWKPGMSSDQLLNEADQAMYKAKRSGKGRLFIPDEQSTGSTRDLKGKFIY